MTAALAELVFGVLESGRRAGSRPDRLVGCTLGDKGPLGDLGEVPFLDFFTSVAAEVLRLRSSRSWFAHKGLLHCDPLVPNLLLGSS